MMNQSSSCVLQALIEATLKILSKESSHGSGISGGGQSERNMKWSTHWLHDIGKFIVQHMNELLEDTNGSHVMITTLEAMGGIRVGRHWSRKTMGFGMKTNIHSEIEKDVIMKELPLAFKHLLKRFAKVLVLERPDRELKEIILGKATSLVQYLLFVLKVRYPELCQLVVRRLVEIVFLDDESKFAITTSSVSAYLVEAVILVSNEHRLSRIWTKHLKGNLKAMWKHDIANFIVQRLIDAAQQQTLVRPHNCLLFHLLSYYCYYCLHCCPLNVHSFKQIIIHYNYNIMIIIMIIVFVLHIHSQSCHLIHISRDLLTISSVTAFVPKIKTSICQLFCI
jgi:hypothetical protein